MDIPPIAITALGGILVLFTYYITFAEVKGGYINNKFWLGMEPSIVYVMMFSKYWL